MSVLATSSAPWWGASVIAASAALGGVLLTLLGTHWRASLELRHKDRSRWDDLILDTATELLAVTGSLAESGKVGYPGYIADGHERTEVLVRAANEFQEAIARFRLVASRDLLRAASRLYEGALTESQGGARSMPTGVPFVAFTDARDEFTVAVRREVRSNP